MNGLCLVVKGDVEFDRMEITGSTSISVEIRK